MTTTQEHNILGFLAQNGKLGFSFGNMMDNELENAEPAQVLASLRSLEKKGYIKLSGPRSLDDLARLITEKSPSLVTVEQQKKAKLAREFNQTILFHDHLEFFDTRIRPTLKGLFAHYTGKTTSKEPTVATSPKPRTTTVMRPKQP